MIIKCLVIHRIGAAREELEIVSAVDEFVWDNNPQCLDKEIAEYKSYKDEVDAVQLVDVQINGATLVDRFYPDARPIPGTVK